MSAVTYQITNFLHGLQRYDGGFVGLVNDMDETSGYTDFASKRLELDAHVRSGDYFEMLATSLDALSSRLERGEKIDRSEIDHIVSELLYIDNRYTLMRR